MENKSTNVFWTKHDALVVLLYNGFVCLPWFFSLFSRSALKKSVAELSETGTLLSAGFWIFAFLPIFVVVWLIQNRKKQSGCSIKELLGFPAGNELFYIITIGVFAGTFLFFLGFIISSYWSSFLRVNGIEAPRQYLIEVLNSGLISKWQIVGIGVVVGVFAPFAEEIIFRGILFEKLRENRNTFIALLLACSFFAVVHTNLFVLPSIFIVGIGFTLVYNMRMSDSASGKVGLLGSMVAHFTFNMFNMVLTLS